MQHNLKQPPKTMGTALFRQTLLMLVGALILSHLVVFLVVVLLPHPDARATKLSDIARQLADPSCAQKVADLAEAQHLQLTRSSQTPTLPLGMRSDPLLQTQLAQVLGVPEASVMLGWHEGSEIRINKAATVTVDNRSNKLQQTLFLREIFFARQWPDYCTASVPSPKWYSRWQARTALIFMLSLSVMIFLAWLFARRLSRPIHEFAAAADAIGRDHRAPLLDEIGPKEMRVAARALNAMQIRIQEQLREREAMIAAIAHDLRTPLSRIAFRVEAASPSVSSSVQRDIEQMNAMIATTLEYASDGLQRRGDELVDLQQLLATMVEDEQAIGRHTSIHFNATSSIVVTGDEVQLSRLFQNLIDNANKFGGSAEINLYQQNDHVIVTVGDRGPGIDSDKIDDMFQPFSRGEPSRNRQTGGIGLGLSITRTIARKHGGDITLSNRDGGGLLVTVTLPISPFKLA